VASSSGSRGTAGFEELRVRSYPSFTRIVIEMSAAAGYALTSEKDEVRVRLMGLQLPAAQEHQVADGLVKELALEPAPGGARLRILLDSAASQIKDLALQDPHRLVIDVMRPKEEKKEAATGGQPLRLMVLDAGHGGHDTGAIGPSGLTEKEVVLDVTRRLARMVEEGLGIKVILTRKDDTFVALRDRANMANRQRADIFVSVHANAHPRSVSEGVETYFLSSEASDSESRQTAAIENGVIQLETGASRARAEALKSILWELAQSEFQHESSFLAETVLTSMTQSLRMVNRGVKQAGFYVLGGAAMPAILIEIGFLTNPKEERRLASAEHREASARAIYAGLAEYKRRYDQRMRGAQARGPAAPAPVSSTR
jgi:N-acetylmuramoyl-L-alanine amidase